MSNRTISDINIDEFSSVVESRLVPRIRNKWMRPRKIKNWAGHAIIDFAFKTYRISLHSHDCDALGSAYPDESIIEEARKIAGEYGFSVRWEECEKGWGSLIFMDERR